MQVSYNTKKSEITITMSWTEVRQFLNLSSVVEMVRGQIREAIKLARN